MNNQDLENRFTYHKPKDNQPFIYQAIRDIGLKFSKYINESVPDCREKSIAITKLEETIMWANAAIARNGLSALSKKQSRK